MKDGLADALGHSAWANRELIESCRRLSQEQLTTKAPGTYGGILQTLQHLVGSESFYRFMFAGAFLDWDWHDHVLPTLDQLAVWSAELAGYWQEMLQSPVDAHDRLVQTTPKGVRHEESAGIMLVQAVHHAAIHREQINAILTYLGVEPPDLDARSYGWATGRSPRPMST